MSALAEDSLDAPSRARKLARAGFVLAVLLLVAGAAWWLSQLSSSASGPKRQVARIALLPDKPPPPPPKEEKRPEPKPEEQRLQQQREARSIDDPKPVNEPIKMEGAAGDGPSAFQSGSVSSEYQGGTPVTGAAGGSGTDRAQERFYANTARQLLRDAIEQHLRSDAAQLAAVFSVWLDSDGTIQRFELRPTGDERQDGALRAALAETSRTLKLPAPPAITQPMRFRLTVRPLG
jgi:hypothetical protein